MQRIYPPNPQIFERWLTQTVHQLVRDNKLRDLAKFEREIGSLHVFSELQNFPKEVHVIKSNDHTWITILPQMLSRKIFRDDTVDHIPIISSNTIKILDPYGDIITTLYFPRRVLAAVRDIQFEVSTAPALAAISARCKSDKSVGEDVFYEMILDRDEAILYRAMTPFRGCSLQQGAIVFKSPAAPAVIVETIGDFDYRVYAEVPNALTIEGALLKVSVEILPFPHFILSFSNCVINDAEYEDLELPSYLLYSSEDPISREKAFELCPALITHLIETRQRVREEMDSLEAADTSDDLK